MYPGPQEIERHIKYKHPQDESQGENNSYMHTTMYNQIILLNSIIPRSKKDRFLNEREENMKTNEE
jgi:hypothetical protein